MEGKALVKPCHAPADDNDYILLCVMLYLFWSAFLLITHLSAWAWRYLASYYEMDDGADQERALSILALAF